MKSLQDYLQEVGTNQEDDMRPKRIMAAQNDGGEALWNSHQDRWSRKAKHPMTLGEREILDTEWTKGEQALYEGMTVEVIISNGPNDTVGISLDGKTKMVSSAKLSKLDEWVLGGIQPLTPINRMMQLAGISSPIIMEPTLESETSDQEVLEEAPAATVLDQIFKQNMNGQFRNNPEAASLATIGQVLGALSGQIEQIRGKIDPQMSEKLESLIALGAGLVDGAKQMLRPQQAEE